MFESRIVKFYENRAHDNFGRSLIEMQHYNHEQLENDHKYIQWMFPSSIKSVFNQSAPVLKRKDVEYIKQSEKIKENMKISLMVITDFLGLAKDYVENKYFVKNSRVEKWLTPENHNFIRLSRILRSLILFDLKDEAQLLLNCLTEIYNNGYKDIIGDSYYHWLASMKNGHII